MKFIVTKHITYKETHEFEVEADSIDEAEKLAVDLECGEESETGDCEAIDEEIVNVCDVTEDN